MVIKKQIIITCIENDDSKLLSLDDLSEEKKDCIIDTLHRCCKYSASIKEYLLILVDKYSDRKGIDAEIFYGLCLICSSAYASERQLELSLTITSGKKISTLGFWEKLFSNVPKKELVNSN